MTTPKTVMIWGRDDLLSSTIELILATQKEWCVINIASEENCEALIQAVDSLCPDVVISHQGVFRNNFQLPTALFQKHPGLKVITASLTTNAIEVYSKQNVTIRSSSDLISIVASSAAESGK